MICEIHCWHVFGGTFWMVIPDGHVVQKCCKCDTLQTIHNDHAHATKWVPL